MICGSPQDDWQAIWGPGVSGGPSIWGPGGCSTGPTYFRFFMTAASMGNTKKLAVAKVSQKKVSPVAILAYHDVPIDTPIQLGIFGSHV